MTLPQYSKGIFGNKTSNEYMGVMMLIQSNYSSGFQTEKQTPWRGHLEIIGEEHQGLSPVSSTPNLSSRPGAS